LKNPYMIFDTTLSPRLGRTRSRAYLVPLALLWLVIARFALAGRHHVPIFSLPFASLASSCSPPPSRSALLLQKMHVSVQSGSARPVPAVTKGGHDKLTFESVPSNVIMSAYVFFFTQTTNP
jgi:hypothetical protein